MVRRIKSPSRYKLDRHAATLMVVSYLCVPLMLVLAALVMGCGASDDASGTTTSTDEPPPPDPPTTCAPDEIALPDGSCQAVGIPTDMECAPGNHLTGGSCIPAGVAPDGCGHGMIHDGDGGCDLEPPQAL